MADRHTPTQCPRCGAKQLSWQRNRRCSNAPNVWDWERVVFDCKAYLTVDGYGQELQRRECGRAVFRPFGLGRA